MRIMRSGMFAFAGCMALALIGTLTGIRPLMDLGAVLLVVEAVVLVILANTKAKR